MKNAGPIKFAAQLETSLENFLALIGCTPLPQVALRSVVSSSIPFCILCYKWPNSYIFRVSFRDAINFLFIYQYRPTRNSRP